MRENELATVDVLCGLVGIWLFFGGAFTVTPLLGAVLVFMIYAIGTNK
ncbi:MAG: hypothetical protein KDA65_16470 [Planctomycetaceae bacterium]|nr:hypothetical protein [Planctomycetaceae bacterium]